jgi:hypothetical protein
LVFVALPFDRKLTTFQAGRTPELDALAKDFSDEVRRDVLLTLLVCSVACFELCSLLFSPSPQAQREAILAKATKIAADAGAQRWV